MIPENVFNLFVAEVKREQVDLAEASMLRPKRELFELGEAAGNYQGLEKALDILKAVLSDEVKKEKSS